MASAAARPRSTAFGADAYPSIHLKAASLLHSIARNHPTLANDEACELVIAVPAGSTMSIPSLATWSTS